MHKIFKEKADVSPGKLKYDIVKILLVAWVLPVALFTVIMVFFTLRRINAQTQRTVMTSSEKAIEICESRLENVKAASRNASYITVIKDSVNEYQISGDYVVLYNNITGFLDEQYRYNDDIAAAIVYLADSPNHMFFTINSTVGSTYENIKIFNYNAKEAVLEAEKELDTGIAFVAVNGRLYMVRNIMGAHFTPIAVIVMEINTRSVYESLESIMGYKDCQVSLDGNIIKDCEMDNKNDFISVKNDKGHGINIIQDGKNAWAFNKSVLNDSVFEYSVMLDGDAIFGGQNVIIYMLLIMGLCVIPLIILVFYFFHKKVTTPVQELSVASKEIEAGNYGYQLEGFNYSEEFRGLGEAFNKMSQELKHQFEQRYVEELALRDANIRALQSQINPHFLNNTLEIINWEARLNGNEKICGMIEALATMTEATMNRRKQPMITLKEELTYVDAYLYIIRQRFGDKFELESSIDDSLKDIMVPRLIIQPIIENAVEHGGDGSGYKKVSISISSDANKLFIVIRNNGRMSDYDIKKIEMLLSGEYDEKNDTSTSLGIRNVNKRLKIIYGKEYGLTVVPGDQNDTISTLTAKIE